MIVLYMERAASGVSPDAVVDGVPTYPATWVLMGALASALLVGFLASRPSRLTRIVPTTLFEHESRPALARVS